MASDPPNLSDLRCEIDALDDQLLELLEKRMRVAIEVARLKGDDGLLKLRPRREGAIVRRLSANATIASDALIAHVWRELMAHSRQSQAAMEVQLYAPRHGAILREAARNRFGRVTPIVEAASPAAAIAAAASGEVVAMIELDAGGWQHELTASVRVFGVLGTGNARAALIGRMDEIDIPDEERAAIAGLGA
ncbi:MAG: chorismate mutase [Sphingomicrobium sp.]